MQYPMIGDPELKIAKLYDVAPAEAGDTSEGRTLQPRTPQCVLCLWSVLTRKSN